MSDSEEVMAAAKVQSQEQEAGTRRVKGLDGMSSVIVPQLFEAIPHAESVAAKVHLIAREKAIETLEEDVLDMTCLKKLWSLLQEVSDLSIENNDLFLDYETLLMLRKQLREQAMAKDAGSSGNSIQLTSRESAQVLAILAPSRLLRLQRDEYGRTSSRAIFTYAHLFSRTRAAEVALRRLCSSQLEDGNLNREMILTKGQLQQFIIDKAREINILSPLSTSNKLFMKQYARIAAQRFCFYECRADKRTLTVPSIIGSPVLSEFLDLQQVSDGTDPNSRALAMHYWFSLPNIRKIYNCFLSLDSRQVGSLTASDFIRFPSVSQSDAAGFTTAFTSRVFEVLANRHLRANKRSLDMSRSGKLPATMALEEFTDFWLAWEDRRSRPALQYFMRIFDIEGRGYLSRSSLKYFLTDIRQGYRELSVSSAAELASFEEHEPFNVDDVIDEVFDMLNSDQKYISLKDFEMSRQSHTAISVLADVYGFIAYDQREQNMHNQDPQEEHY